MGKSKLAPTSAHTVPRIELCAAVLAVELAQTIIKESDIEFQTVNFYTDSKIVLGYIHNSTCQFYVYVANIVALIRKVTKPEQWHHVATEQNPANHGTRLVLASQLQYTTWLTGPQFLQTNTEHSHKAENFDLVDPTADMEARSQVTTLATNVEENKLGSHRFERFSTWKSLIKGMQALINIAKSFSKTTNARQCDKTKGTDSSEAKTVIIKSVQQEVFGEEIKRLSEGKKMSSHSLLQKLDSFVDSEGLLRVGGRLQAAKLPDPVKHPLIIPSSHYVATLLVRHYHDRVAHQGRQFTEGALRDAELWVPGVKRLVYSIIHKCVICRKLRGRLNEQKWPLCLFIDLLLTHLSPM